MRKFTPNTKSELLTELNKIAMRMALEEDPEKFHLLKERYDVLSKMVTPSWTVSPDTLLTVGANLAGILLVLNYERLDIISTKAFGLLIKGRV